MSKEIVNILATKMVMFSTLKLVNVIFYIKRNFAVITNLNILKWGDLLDFLVGSYIITRAFIRSEEGLK